MVLTSCKLSRIHFKRGLTKAFRRCLVKIYSARPIKTSIDNLRKPRRVFRLPTSNFQLPTSNFQLPTSNFRLPTSNFRLLISDFQLPWQWKAVICRFLQALPTCSLQGNRFQETVTTATEAFIDYASIIFGIIRHHKRNFEIFSEKKTLLA